MMIVTTVMRGIISPVLDLSRMSSRRVYFH
jgi:hypothetical protein